MSQGSEFRFGAEYIQAGFLLQYNCRAFSKNYGVKFGDFLVNAGLYAVFLLGNGYRSTKLSRLLSDLVAVSRLFGRLLAPNRNAASFRAPISSSLPEPLRQFKAPLTVNGAVSRREIGISATTPPRKNGENATKLVFPFIRIRWIKHDIIGPAAG